MAQIQHAGLQAEKIRHVAVDHGQALNRTIVDGISECGVTRVQGRCLPGHVHCLRDRLQAHLEVNGGGFAHQQFTLFALIAKALGADADSPRTRIELVKAILPMGVGRGFECLACRSARDAHGPHLATRPHWNR